MKKLIVMLMMMAPVAVFAQKFGKVNTQTIMQSLPELSKVMPQTDRRSHGG